MGFAAPLVVKHRRLVNSQREYRLATDEVTNQFERLTALPSGRVEQAIEQLTLSTFAADRLPEAKLRGEIRSVEIGLQITVSITWEQPTAAPVTITGSGVCQIARRRQAGASNHESNSQQMVPPRRLAH